MATVAFAFLVGRNGVAVAVGVVVREVLENSGREGSLYVEVVEIRDERGVW